MTPELHRPIAADRVGAAGLEVVVVADAAECAALALRLHVPSVARLRCTFRLTRLTDTIILATGVLDAELVQTCVISLEDFSGQVTDRFRVRFVPAGTESDDLDPEADDEVGYAGGVLDLGEAAAEQLALALDPYPRAPGAELPDIATDGPDHPFAALRRRH